MEQNPVGGEEGPDSRSPGRVLLFSAALAAYYALYSWMFAGRVGEYFGDVLKHFAFVRRFLP
jgi:hypothetical protein